MRKTGIFMALISLTLAACGGGDDSSFAGTAPGGGETTTVARVLLVSDVSSIPSDGSLPAELTAYVQDATSQFVANVPVAFTSDTGGLQVTQAVTDTTGTATANLSAAGDPANRTITVTATAGGVSTTATVSVTGTTLTIQGPASLPLGGSGADYIVTLNNAASMGVANRTVTLTAPSFVTANATTAVTNSQGQATFRVTGGASGSGSLSVSSLGVTAQQSISVNSNALIVSAPAAGAQVPLLTPQAVTANFSQGGSVVAGATINFSTTRGTLSASSAVTDASGNATVSVQSATAGGVVVTATETGSASTGQQAFEFVATVPASIDAQPSVFTLAPNQQSTVTALVRDAAGNLVKGRTVTFSLTADSTGGSLSVGSAVTDSQGRAQTVYTAGSVTSANGGVQIVAAVQNTAIQDTVALTVAGRQVFISIGTGNQISEPNTAQYKKEYVVQVTDSTGAGVSGVSLSLEMLSVTYYKGERMWSGTTWVSPTTASCADEDANRNGMLDSNPNEDFNGSDLLEAGNIATVAPASVVTDSNGFALVGVYYPQEYAYWLTVSLKALASVQGTEFARISTFLLEGLASDFNSENTAPPGEFSPFGQSATCADTL